MGKPGRPSCAGYEFGAQGDAFLRMNVACPRCTLTKALEQIEVAVESLRLGEKE